MNKVKALKTAKEWLYPSLMFAIFDCCDSMHNSEALENRFNAYVEDSISIEDFVKKNLRKEYIKEAIKVAQHEGSPEEILEILQNTPSSLVFAFEEIRAEIEKELNIKK